jgi:hypothetical protein
VVVKTEDDLFVKLEELGIDESGASLEAVLRAVQDQAGLFNGFIFHKDEDFTSTYRGVSVHENQRAMLIPDYRGVCPFARRLPL